MKFDKYHIASAIKANLARQGFKRPTDIQYKAIPPILNGEDVLAVAQTGTGKTAAFAIPVIDRIAKLKRSRKTRGIRCLVMVPTRELAVQINTVFCQLAGNTRVKSLAVYGGVEQDAQIDRLIKGVDVLVATPGRMFDLISQGVVSLDRLETLVLDEADQMLDLGFINDIKAIKKKLKTRHQTLFFSATINKQIKKLAFSQVRSNAIRIQVSPDDPVSKNVSHSVAFVRMDDKRFFLRRFIKAYPKERILVFVRTRVRAERVFKALERSGIRSQTLHGEKDQAERESVLAVFKKGDCRVLIATDVSARGIDIPNVSFVINYDLPDQAETYVHRVGRTGRGRQKGSALSFCSQRERPLLEAIQQLLPYPISEIAISKNEYADTLVLEEGQQDLRAMILEHEARGKKGRKRKGRS